jgi:uncharacterized protein (DUF2141 family)
MNRLPFFIFIAAFLLVAVPSANAQIFKTSLTLTVRDDVGNTVEKVTVKLYELEADYLKEENPAAEGETDAKGVVKFKNLKAIPYFVLARKENKDNAGGGEQTGQLEEGKFNKATIVIQ